jgi:hypothetical protein
MISQQTLSSLHPPRVHHGLIGLVPLPVKSGEFNRSMQHWLEVYSPGFQSPRFSPLAEIQPVPKTVF